MVTQQRFRDSLYRVYSPDSGLNDMTLEDILRPIKRIDQLRVPRGTRVLVRCDLDVPLADGKVADSARIDSLAQTLRYACEQGWIPIVFGHIGRDPKETLRPIAQPLGETIGREIEFVADWIDTSGQATSDSARNTIASAREGQVFMLENTRQYDIERVMWKMKPDGFETAVPRLYALAKDMYDNFATVYINEALAASNFDFSSAVLPLVMDQVAFGFFVDDELRHHVAGARSATLVVFSGLKIDKLDDLEDAIDRGVLKLIIAAGSLAMALKKAQSQLDGGDFHLGIAEEDETAKAYIPPKRIDQAKRMVEKCRAKKITLVLPVDFVLNDGTISELIPSGMAQLDIGPKTRDLYSATLEKFGASSPNPALFHNGVFGKFEDPKFEEGTRSFMIALMAATKRGVRTYIGGGEGRMALLKYGSLSDATHAFTAGGTILKSLGNKHIAFVKANFVRASELQ